MGSPHPIAWYIEEPTSAKPLLDGAPKTGRSFYTALGHFNESECSSGTVCKVPGPAKLASSLETPCPSSP